jgi:hypothetical protein
MGYYTYFDLQIEDQGDYEEDLIKEFIEENENAKYGIDENGDCTDCFKWYGHEEEMKEFSKKFPKALFALHGNGDDSDDFWIKYFRDGKMQECQASLVYPEFNGNELK